MNHLNYHHLFYFLTVCQEGGFTRAALKLRLSQSAVSEQVRKLEEILGQRLIARTTRRFELTESGRVALKYAELIFGAGQELMDFMMHRPNQGVQVIRIGALGTLSRNLQMQFLSPLLDRKDVTLNLIVGDSKRLFKLLKDHEIDLILSTFPASEQDASEVYTHMLMQSPLCIVSKKLKRGMELKEIFLQERVYLPSRSLESRADFDHWVESNGLSFQVAGQIEDVALLRLIALSGKGIVVIPRMGVLKDLESRTLSVLHEFKGIKQKYYAITRQKKVPNTFISELIKNLKNLG